MNKFLQLAFLLRFAIAIAYVLLGITLFMLPVKIVLLNNTAKLLFSVLLILYGIFRLYRAFHSLKEQE